MFDRFGCCPDGILSATGPDNQGCPSCNETSFGCCPDGITSALGPDGMGCDDEGKWINKSKLFNFLYSRSLLRFL